MMQIQWCKWLKVLSIMTCPALYPMAGPMLTQSEAHFNVPIIHETIERWYRVSDTPEYQKLYDNVVRQERKRNTTHYVFYNAFSNEWRVPQDLYLELYIALHPVVKFNKKVFRAFRWIPVDHKTPEQLLKEEMIQHGMIDDNEWRVKANVLSTNLALFGNVGFPGECTFEYFLNAKSNTKVSTEIFKSILDLFDSPAHYEKDQTPMLYKYIPQLQDLDRYLSARKISTGKEPQTLSQIFIPRDMVDKVAYMAWVKGVPYEPELINWVINNTAPALGKQPQFKHADPFMRNIIELFKDKQQGHPLFAKILDGIEKGVYRISALLDRYKTNISSLPNAGNNIQARLFVSPEYIGNPGGGVEVLVYDFIPREDKFAYEKELKNIVYAIRSDILRRAKRETEQKINIRKNLDDLARSLAAL